MTKKRTRRAQKFQRAVVGATLQARDLLSFYLTQIWFSHFLLVPLLTSYGQDIMAKRNQKPEVRKAQREQAVRAAKDQKKATVKKPAVKVRNCQICGNSIDVCFVDAYLFFTGKKCLLSPSRTRLRRRHRRQQRTSRRPAPAGLAARDKYFAFKFL